MQEHQGVYYKLLNDLKNCVAQDFYYQANRSYLQLIEKQRKVVKNDLLMLSISLTKPSIDGQLILQKIAKSIYDVETEKSPKECRRRSTNQSNCLPKVKKAPSPPPPSNAHIIMGTYKSE